MLRRAGRFWGHVRQRDRAGRCLSAAIIACILHRLAGVHRQVQGRVGQVQLGRVELRILRRSSASVHAPVERVTDLGVVIPQREDIDRVVGENVV